MNELPFYKPHGNEIELFEHAYKNHLPLLIKGPTGCGKTRFVAHMAAKLGLPLYTVACHDDLTASDLVGRHLIGDGVTYWNDGPLTRAVREGGICYLDEVVEARCRALLRRRQQFADPVLRAGDLELNRIEHKVARGGRPIGLTAKEFSLLECLLLHQGECVSRSQLLMEVWQMSAETGTNVVDVYVNYLRRKVEGGVAKGIDGELIETVRGSGYRLGGVGKKPVMRHPGRPAPVRSVACA